MRPVPVRASSCRGSASRRRHCFAAAPVAKPIQAPTNTQNQQ
ncbi:hypothetical protein [Vibrio rumoiensis]|nr:hypothetical protein [Vibrio rumoiensis]